MRTVSKHELRASRRANVAFKLRWEAAEVQRSCAAGPACEKSAETDLNA